MAQKLNGESMKNQGVTSNRLGRHTHLARALGLALTLGMTGAMAAQTSPASQGHALASSHTVLTRAAVSGQTSLPATTIASHKAAASTNSTASTITVTNCNDSGSGSLRAAVDFASSGDTIDMSGLSSCKLMLNSSIVTSVDDLTIKGRPNSKYPQLDGQFSVTPLVHNGSGTLTLTDLRIQQGRFVNGGSIARGGCVASGGKIKLIDTQVIDCESENTSGGIAQGGALAGLGGVSLSGSTVTGGVATNTGSGKAEGGGIWSQGTVSIDDESQVNFSKALTAGPNLATAKGGGIWSQGSTTVDHESLVNGNTAQAYGSGNAEGGGIFSSGNLTIGHSSAVTSNTASAASNNALGGGAFTQGDATVKYAQFEDNLAESEGSGTVQGGGLRVGDTLLTKYTSFTDNKATSTSGSSFGGAVQSFGNVSIRNTTISGNTAGSVGGLMLSGTSATQALIISNSTISGNFASYSTDGAGIFVGQDAEISNSTITGNREVTPSGYKYGAGLALKHDVNVDLSSTIISGNKVDTGSGLANSDIGKADNGGNATLSGDHNLVGTSTISVPAGTINTINPRLEALADNGGLTQTHALMSTSQAINTGSANSQTSDQRGPGFDRVVGSSADIGAFESDDNDEIFANGFD